MPARSAFRPTPTRSISASSTRTASSSIPRPWARRKRATSASAGTARTASGNVVANGPLQIVVDASGGGQAVAATTATWTCIAGIQSPANGGATKLVTGLGLLMPDAAIRLS